MTAEAVMEASEPAMKSTSMEARGLRGRQARGRQSERQGARSNEVAKHDMILPSIFARATRRLAPMFPGPCFLNGTMDGLPQLSECR